MLQLLQLFLIILLLVPFLHWARSRLADVDWHIDGGESHHTSIFTVLLPMRNEQHFVERKILEVIEEAESSENINLLLVDSNSTDSTSEIAFRVLENSTFADHNWEVIKAEKPGKSHAINLAISITESDFFIMMDADAETERGWLEIIINSFSDPEVGVISGLERSDTTSRHRSRKGYRSASDSIRSWESAVDSTAVLEGALIAWRTSALRDFSLDEKTNADDAQITFEAIRRGYRTISVPELRFSDRNDSTIWHSRSIRRSQGLSRVILRNLDLAFSAPRKKARSSVFNAIALYIIFPWALALLVASQIFSIVLVSNGGVLGKYVIPAMALTLIITQSGRSAVWGSIISIIAHIQIIFGRTYGAWEPKRPIG